MDIKTAVLITEEQIQKRVQELAQTLNQKFQKNVLVAVAVLKGSFSFYSDLIRALSCRVMCDFCIISSYGSKLTPAKKVQLIMDTQLDMEGKHVLLVEDIIDTGHTLDFLKDHFKRKNPLSLSTVALVSKKPSEGSLVDYVGFRLGDSGFLVGYGLDYDEKFRHLPYIAEISSFN